LRIPEFLLILCIAVKLKSDNMRKIELFLALVFIVLFNGSLCAQGDIDQLLEEFTLSEWKLVKEAKIKLENYEEAAIGDIVKLLDRDEFVKLTNTGSLIYPGAERIYGHGQIIDYSIDNLSIRAGWLLEDITFNNFGFSGCHLPDENLVSFIKITFPEYYNNANNRKKIEASDAAELRRLIHKLSVKNAKDWWEKEGDGWTRLDGLVQALRSFDEKRQVKALFYMRNGETRCTGLDKEYYIDNISKEVVRLSTSDTQRVSEHARWILFDTKFIWLENKMQ
jgi:hypothetical protein